FGDREGGGLLQIDVLTRTRRINGDGCVPMVGRTDEYCVDILVREQLAIVVIHLDTIEWLSCLLAINLVNELLCIIGTFCIEIAYSDDLRIVVTPHAGHVVHPRYPARANGSDIDPIRW